MPTIADMLAIGKRIEFEGEGYDLREPNVLEMGMFERWLEQGAKDSARRDTEQSRTSWLRDLPRSTKKRRPVSSSSVASLLCSR